MRMGVDLRGWAWLYNGQFSMVTLRSLWRWIWPPTLMCRRGAVLPGFILWLVLFQLAGQAATLQDMFDDRQVVTNWSGSLKGNNSDATAEPGEPKHGGKSGGHSLWISWIAPTNGIVQFETEASDVSDTLLSAYYFASTNQSSFDQLIEAARSDDAERYGDRESEVEFGVRAGQRYEIAVDGYYGARGRVELEWQFTPTDIAPPLILATPPDMAVDLNASVTLSVLMADVPPEAAFRWYLNGRSINSSGPELVIPAMQPSDVGRYKLRIDLNGIRYYAVPTELQINTEGLNVLAYPKLPEALDHPVVPVIASNVKTKTLLSGASGPTLEAGTPIGVVRGYSGSQIFNTTYGTIDPNEPPHCGVSGGASFWLQYQPPVDGTVTLDTAGSGFDTAMEVYTYNGVPTGYPDLISVACDSSLSNGAARVQFPVLKTRRYAIAVAGMNGARGTAYLNYELNTNEPPQRPTLLSIPKAMVVAQGSDVILAPDVAGCPPLQFIWTKDGKPVAATNAPALFVPHAAATNSGNYGVTIQNDLGVLNTTLPLQVVAIPECNLMQSANGWEIQFETTSGLHYVIEEASGILGPWNSWTNTFSGDGQPITIRLPAGGTRFFRLRVE